MARALHQQGMLAGLVTDWYAFGERKRPRDNETTPINSVSASTRQSRCRERADNGLSGVRGPWSVVRGLCSVVCRPVVPRSALTARAEGIPDGLVRSFPFRSLLWKWRVRRLAAQGRSHEAYLQTDNAFAAAVARLKLPPHEVFFGYSYASLEMLEAEKKRGVLTVLDQIDPGAVEFRLVAEEMARFPALAGPPPEFPAAYYERNRREWALADRIVVNSEFCRQALVKQGVPAEKLVVVPLAYEAVKETTGPRDYETTRPEGRGQSQESRKHPPTQSYGATTGPRDNGTTGPRDNETTGPKVSGQWSVVSSPSTVVSGHVVRGPLKVLWLGQVNVRKGIQYLLAAARKLEGENIRFDVVGPIGISQEAIASAPRNMTFHGRATRDQAANWYRQADLFVLPTLSDGFAITQLEAMAHGLPVVTTPCCGDVVSDGVDGFIIPPRDADALARTLQRYLKEPKLLLEQRIAALEKSKQFTLDHLSANLLRLEAALGDKR